MTRTAVFAASLALLALSASQAAPARGGSMVVSYKDDVTTLDPAIGYDLPSAPTPTYLGCYVDMVVSPAEAGPAGFAAA